MSSVPQPATALATLEESDPIAAQAHILTDQQAAPMDPERADEASSLDKDADDKAEEDVDPQDLVESADQLDPRFEASRKEIWSYYSYGIGNNGLGMFNFAPTAAQNLLYIAAGDSGTLYFAGKERTITQIVLLSNGISCALNVVLFLLLGSLADFGKWRPYILMAWTGIAFAISMAWLGVHEADKWHVGMGLYIVGLIVYQMALSFWTAAFPGLARNTPVIRKAAQDLSQGRIKRDEFEFASMMQRNRISNVSFIVQSAAEILILVVIVGIMFGVHVNDGQEQNNRGLSILIAFSGAVWVLVALPWFVYEKHRPGQPLPPNSNILTAGLKQLWTALREVVQLKQSLLYLFGYFLLSDSLNTTVTVIGTLQNTIVSYNTLTLTYLLIAGIAAQLAGILGFWIIQKRFGLTTKTMFTAVMISIVLLDGWGLIGVFTQRFGFHSVWEIWLYQVYYGLFVCPWYSYSMIMVAEVTPKGREFLFFSLFGCFGRVSAVIGPLVSTAIIDRTPNNNSTPFYFLFGLTLFSSALLIFFLDVKKSRREQKVFLQKQGEKLLQGHVL